MVYIFHHVAKSGGTAVRETLSREMNIVRDYVYIKEEHIDCVNRDNYTDYIVPPVDLNSPELGDRDLICGHYDDSDWLGSGFRVFERYPAAFDNPNVRVFAFLRNPIDFYVSLFRFKHMYKELGVKTRKAVSDSFEEFLEEHKNCYAFLFNAGEGDTSGCINKYWYIGIHECLQLSFDILCDKIGLSPMALDRINITETKVDVSYAEKRLVMDRCESDFIVYKQALDLFGEEVREFMDRRRSALPEASSRILGARWA